MTEKGKWVTQKNSVTLPASELSLLHVLNSFSMACFQNPVSALHLRLRFEVNYSFTMTKTTALHIPLISMHVAKITE